MDQPSAADAKPRKVKLSPEEHRQLLTHHMSKLRAKRAEIDELRAPLKDAQEEFTALINEMKADMGKGYTRKYITVLLEDTTTRLRNLLQEEERRARDREALGLPVFGIQVDLFDNAATAKMPAEARDEISYEAEGYLRGRNGLLEPLPDGTPPRFHQAVLRGFERGQKATHEDILAAAELRKRQSEPDAAAEPKNLNGAGGEPEPGTPEAKAKERKSVAKAKESLAKLGDGKGADGFEADQAELAGQKPRQAAQQRREAAEVH